MPNRLSCSTQCWKSTAMADGPGAAATALPSGCSFDLTRDASGFQLLGEVPISDEKGNSYGIAGPPHLASEMWAGCRGAPFMGGWLTSEIWVLHLRDAFIVLKILSRFASFLLGVSEDVLSQSHLWRDAQQHRRHARVRQARARPPARPSPHQ